jgi:hypothetical protein
MAITQTWRVKELMLRSSWENRTNVIYQVRWELYTAGDNNVGAMSTNGWTELDPRSISNTWTEYADLTEAQVLAWTQAAMSRTWPENTEVNAYNTVINQQHEQSAQTVVGITEEQLPWAASS